MLGKEVLLLSRDYMNSNEGNSIVLLTRGDLDRHTAGQLHFMTEFGAFRSE